VTDREDRRAGKILSAFMKLVPPELRHDVNVHILSLAVSGNPPEIFRMIETWAREGGKKGKGLVEHNTQKVNRARFRAPVLRMLARHFREKNPNWSEAEIYRRVAAEFQRVVEEHPNPEDPDEVAKISMKIVERALKQGK